MADTEIAVLFKAIDNMSATMKSIEGKLDIANKGIRKQTEATTNTFDKQMGSMLVLGQAANQVEGIMTSYNNLQLRLENANDRLMNAQDRLTKATSGYNKVMNSGTATAQEMKDARMELDQATRGLEISENNLARANGMVAGTYIQIGLQIGSLLKQLPVLKTAMAEMMGVATVTTGGFFLVVAAVGALIYGLTELTGKIGEVRKSLEDMPKTLQEFDDIMADIEDKFQTIKEASDRVAQNLGLRVGKSEDEAKLIADMAKNEALMAELDAKRTSTGKLGTKDLEKYNKLEAENETLDKQLDVLQKRADADNAHLDYLKIANDKTQTQVDINNQAYQDTETGITTLTSMFYEQLGPAMQAVMIDKIDEAKVKLGEFEKQYNDMVWMRSVAGMASMVIPGVGQATGITGKQNEAVAQGRPWWEVLLGITSDEDPIIVAKDQMGSMFMEITKQQEVAAQALSDGLGFMLGSPEKGSYPIVYSLIQAENEWTTMADLAVTEIDKIVVQLNKIPKSYTTIHYIKTVYI